MGVGSVEAKNVEAMSTVSFRANPFSTGDTVMQWTTPSFTDLRFGFEITMYIANR
jgi:coenzyme PQQ precursor peptide PqqA